MPKSGEYSPSRVRQVFNRVAPTVLVFGMTVAVVYLTREEDQTKVDVVPVQTLPSFLPNVVACGYGTEEDEGGDNTAYVELGQGRRIDLSDPHNEQLGLRDIFEASQKGEDLSGPNELLLEIANNRFAVFEFSLEDGKITSARQLTQPMPATDAAIVCGN